VTDENLIIVSTDPAGLMLPASCAWPGCGRPSWSSAEQRYWLGDSPPEISHPLAQAGFPAPDAATLQLTIKLSR
jgi:hypothetical protein